MGKKLSTKGRLAIKAGNEARERWMPSADIDNFDNYHMEAEYACGWREGYRAAQRDARRKAEKGLGGERTRPRVVPARALMHREH